MSDLISRDVLFNEISNIINRHENKPLDVSWLVPSDGLITALVSILKAPAVDAVEVVHGEWIGNWISCDEDLNGYFDGYKCLECDGVNEERTPYCPNCGAKMDKRRESEVSE